MMKGILADLFRECLGEIEADPVDCRAYNMDTDDLSEEAYEVLTTAHGINEFLWVQLGALSSKYEDEEGYLEGVLKFIRKIRKDPEGFQDLWLMEEPINDKHLLQLEEQITNVQSISYHQRHFPEY